MKSIVFTLIISAAIVSCAPQVASDAGYGSSPASTSPLPSGAHGAGFGPNGDVYEDQDVPPYVPLSAVLASGAHGVGYGPNGDFGDVKPANKVVPVANGVADKHQGGGKGAGFGPNGDVSE